MKLILALDQSTSATKAVLFQQDGKVVARASREHRQIYPQPGWVEHDAEEIWQNTLTVLAELSSSHREQVQDAAALSITNQRETIVVFSRQTGKPLHNAIVWQCRRGAEFCASLSAAGHDEVVQKATGLKIDTYFSASKLSWLVHEKPEIAAQLASGDALVGTIDSYLIYRLTGGAVHATDHTNASRTLLYNIGDLRWDERLCQLFEVPIGSLPEVRDSFAHYGSTDAEGRLPSGLTISGVMGDSQASLFAQRCYKPGMIKATFGTGTSVMLNVGNQFSISKQGSVAALAWVYQGVPTYAAEGLINYSSATIAWLRDQMQLVGDANETESLARSVEDNGGVYFVPAFAGLSAPYWAPQAKAAIVGLTAYAKREHVVRAALESIGYQIRDVLQMMNGESGISPTALYADGGPTRNAFLMQFVADLNQIKLIVSDTMDSSALGVATAGLVGIGVYDSLEALSCMPRSERVFEPVMRPDQVERLVNGWKDAVRRVIL